MGTEEYELVTPNFERDLTPVEIVILMIYIPTNGVLSYETIKLT